MVSATRKTKRVPPSGLAARMLKFATSKTIDRFCNGWLVQGRDRIFVRKGVDGRFHLANWWFERKGKGHAKQILDYFEQHIREQSIPYKGLKVESVGNQRFAAFFRARMGWKEVEDGLPFVPTFVYDAERA